MTWKTIGTWGSLGEWRGFPRLGLGGSDTSVVPLAIGTLFAKAKSIPRNATTINYCCHLTNLSEPLELWVTSQLSISWPIILEIVICPFCYAYQTTKYGTFEFIMLPKVAFLTFLQMSDCPQPFWLSRTVGPHHWEADGTNALVLNNDLSVSWSNLVKQVQGKKKDSNTFR